MRSIEGKREREKEIVVEMIALNCRANHADARAAAAEAGGCAHVLDDPRYADLCPACAELAAYACERSDRCPYMETKTFCVNCETHCYRADMRERIREAMRYAGPRMIFHRPVAAMRHLIDQKREKRRLDRRAREGAGA